MPLPLRGRVRTFLHANVRRNSTINEPLQQFAVAVGDVSQSAAVPAGLFRRNQPHIAGDLLAAVKAFGSSNYRLESEGRQRTDSGMGHQPPRYRSLLDLIFQRAGQFLDLRGDLVK